MLQDFFICEEVKNISYVTFINNYSEGETDLPQISISSLFISPCLPRSWHRFSIKKP